MPHLVIEYSRDLEDDIEIMAVMEVIKNAAITSAVMSPTDIKVRAIPYDYYLLTEKRDQFVHTSVYLLEGRTTKEKYKLSSLIREAMVELLPKIKNLSVDIRDMNADAYLKRLLQK